MNGIAMLIILARNRNKLYVTWREIKNNQGKASPGKLFTGRIS